MDAEFAAAAKDNTSSLCILDEARLLRTKATIREALDLMQQAYSEQLAAKGDAELLQRFDAAERAWEQYAEQGSYLYFCPIPGDAGNHTLRHAFFGVTLPLYAHHERFLEKPAGAKL